MDCRRAQDHLSRERDGALGNDQRAALVQHLATCPSCERMRAVLVATIESWRATAAGTPVPDPERAWQDLRREWRMRASNPPRRTPYLWVALPMAAAAALTVMLFFNPSAGPAPAVAPAVVRAQAPATTGSTVVLVDDKSGFVFVFPPDEPRQI